MDRQKPHPVWYTQFGKQVCGDRNYLVNGCASMFEVWCPGQQRWNRPQSKAYIIPCIHTLLLNVVSLRCIRNPTSPKRHCENVRSLTISSNISTQSSIESTMMAAVCDVTQKLDAQSTCNTRNLLLDLKTADTRTHSHRFRSVRSRL